MKTIIKSLLIALFSIIVLLGPRLVLSEEKAPVKKSAPVAQKSSPAAPKTASAVEKAPVAKEAAAPEKAEVIIPEKEEATVEAAPVQDSAGNLLKALVESKNAEAVIEPVVTPPVQKTILDAKKPEKTLPWLKTALSFLFVSSMAVLLIFLLSGKAGKPSHSLSQAAKSTRVTQTISLGLKRQLWVVDFEGQKLLLSASGNSNVEVLHALNQDSIISQRVPQKQAEVVGVASTEEARPTAPQEAASAYREAQNLTATPSPVAPAIPETISPSLTSRIRDTVTLLRPMKGARMGKNHVSQA